jgi:uncharacterized iron-regulated membrane protein
MKTTFKPAHTKVSPIDSPLYRRVWRWHFYAGLVCLPFVFLLATTGAIYLFHVEIEDIVYRNELLVTPQAGVLTAQQIINSAIHSVPGQVLSYIPAKTIDRSAEVDVKINADKTLQVFVNPATGQVLGKIDESMRLTALVRSLHSLTLLGNAANHWIEVVAGWVIVLVVTGVYLWWPRGRSGGITSLRQTPAARIWWRDLHAVSGILASGIILFFALTGMPWTAFWGKQFNRFINEQGLGVPPQILVPVPQHHQESTDSMSEMPWSLGEQPLPQSNSETGRVRVGVDQLVAELERIGLNKGYALSLPQTPDGVYTAEYLPDQVAGQRVVHLDQYTGKLLADVDYAHYGVVGKLTEWGISIHKGREYGRINKLILLSGALALFVMTVSAAIMWWKRRPMGKLAAPQCKDADRLARGAMFIAFALGLLFPLLGTSMLVALAIDSFFPKDWRTRWEL